jgi:hypothetical protein
MQKEGGLVMSHLWLNGKIRDPSVGIPEGTKVLVRKSDEVHTSIGPTWWIYDGTNIRQVAESFGGHGMYKIVTKGSIFSKQEAAEARFAPLHRAYRRSRSKTYENPLKSIKKAVKRP